MGFTYCNTCASWMRKPHTPEHETFDSEAEAYIHILMASLKKLQISISNKDINGERISTIDEQWNKTIEDITVLSDHMKYTFFYFQEGDES